LPVSITRSSQSVTATTATVNISTSTMPSPQEKIYVRYTTGADFSGSGTSTVIQATGSGMSYAATFPVGGTTRYFVFSSTLSLAQLSFNGSDFLSPTATEAEKNIGVLRFDDNAGANFVALVPTAAQSSAGGRVVNSGGRGLARVRIAVTNQQGETRSTTTNQFGYYRIDELNTGEIYIFQPQSKTYQFNPQVLTITENLDNLNFVAL
jgi:Carboxypeptidase regulatory-like domain